VSYVIFPQFNSKTPIDIMLRYCCFSQVCFKHPDLLKQAREACVAKRRELCTAARARRFDRSEVGVLTTSLPEEMTPSNGTFTKLLPDNVSSPIGALTTSLPGVVTSPIGAVSNPPLSVTDAEDERSKIPFGSMMNIEEDYRQQLGNYLIEICFVNSI
jgi:hypothetical protein